MVSINRKVMGIMKKFALSLSSCILAAVLLCASLPGFAASAKGYPDEYSMGKLLAFWQQEAHDGLNNGEAVYAVDWTWTPEHYNEFGGAYPTYDGSYWTHLVYRDVLPEGFMFLFGYRVSCWMSEELEDGSVIVADGYEYVFPDLYGDLDLSGTNVTMVAPYVFADGGDGISTHINSVNLNDCGMLTRVRLVGQEQLETTAALNCEELEQFIVKDCACRQISFKTKETDQPLMLNVLGAGAVGVEYIPSINTVYAYPAGDTFFGWYENGNCVSTELEYSRDKGGKLTAVFSGDADGDGLITSSDALTLLRCSMGLIEINAETALLDVNVNGTVDSTDALSVLRLAMGIV